MLHRQNLISFWNKQFAEFRIKTCLINVMNERKFACYRFENIGFEIDLSAKENGIESSPKTVEKKI